MRIAGCRSAIGAVAVTASLALAACNATTRTVSPSDAEGTAIVFESIDGPPRPVSARLTRSLDQEAAARRLVVVPRGGQAVYRIRGYLAANPEGGATAVAWAFDVYDAERRRAFRLRGEERAAGGSSAAGSWSAVNDALLQRIATNSVEQLMTLIASDGPGVGAQASAAPSGTSPASSTPRSRRAPPRAPRPLTGRMQHSFRPLAALFVGTASKPRENRGLAALVLPSLMGLLSDRRDCSASLKP
jgi:hypothetical protein